MASTSFLIHLACKNKDRTLCETRCFQHVTKSFEFPKPWFPRQGEVWLPEIPGIAQLRNPASAAAGASAGSAAGSGAGFGGDETRRRWGCPFSAILALKMVFSLLFLVSKDRLAALGLYVKSESWICECFFSLMVVCFCVFFLPVFVTFCLLLVFLSLPQFRWWWWWWWWWWWCVFFSSSFFSSSSCFLTLSLVVLLFENSKFFSF